MADDRHIKATVEVARIQTLADGGLRWTFDAPETAVMQSAELMECKRLGAVVDVDMTIRFPDSDSEYGGRLK